jgi:hypothetical protein
VQDVLDEACTLLFEKKNMMVAYVPPSRRGDELEEEEDEGESE